MYERETERGEKCSLLDKTSSHPILMKEQIPLQIRVIMQLKAQELVISSKTKKVLVIYM